MKKMTALVAIMATTIGFTAITEDVNMDMKTWKGGKVIADGKVLEATNMTMLSSPLIPIDPKANYQLSGMLKSGNTEKNQIYLGMQFFNAKKQYIHPTTVTPIAKSETVLTADAKKGDKAISLKDASKMVKQAKIKRLQIGFESDKGLPNTKLSPKVIKLEQKDGTWVATLQKPLAYDVAKGTKVMGHSVCGHYMYVYYTKKNFKDWTKVSGTIKPEVKTGSPNRAIWPSAKFAKIVVLANWGQKKGEVLLVKDIVLTTKTK